MGKIEEMISFSGSERAILTIIMKNTDNILKCEELGLKKEHFSVKANRYIYSAIAYLMSQGYDRIDSVAIINTLDNKGKEELNLLGGLEYIDLLLMTEIYDNIGIYVEKVVNAYKRRNIYTLCEETKDKMLDDDVNLPVVLDNVQDNLLSLSLSKVPPVVSAWWQHYLSTPTCDHVLVHSISENPPDSCLFLF